jgi:hypothetical protein
VLATFSISKLLKILDSENKYLEYTLHGISNDGIILLMKNYVFFLQVVDSENGCDIVLIKRSNTILYQRFNPHAHTVRLLDPLCLTFWVGNAVVSLGGTVNPCTMIDPYLPPETLLAKQLELKRLFPPHHPRVLQLLIETNNITLLIELLRLLQRWMKQEKHKIAQIYDDLTL